MATRGLAPGFHTRQEKSDELGSKAFGRVGLKWVVMKFAEAVQMKDEEKYFALRTEQKGAGAGVVLVTLIQTLFEGHHHPREVNLSTHR